MVVVFVVMRACCVEYTDQVPQWTAMAVFGNRQSAEAWMKAHLNESPMFEWKIDRCPLL